MASSMNRLSRVRPRQQRTQFTQKATCALDASKLPEAQNGFTLTDTPLKLMRSNLIISFKPTLSRLT